MKALTWDELADWYEANVGGRRARTLPMDDVFEACVATGKFTEHADGSLTLKEPTAKSASSS